MEEILKLIVIFGLMFVGFLLFFKFYAIYKGKKLEGKTVDIIENGILYFYSPKCGACKMMEKTINNLSSLTDVLKINVFDGKNENIVKNMNIMATPTTVVIKEGKVKKVFIGVVGENKIKKEVEI